MTPQPPSPEMPMMKKLICSQCTGNGSRQTFTDEKIIQIQCSECNGKGFIMVENFEITSPQSETVNVQEKFPTWAEKLANYNPDSCPHCQEKDKEIEELEFIIEARKQGRALLNKLFSKAHFEIADKNRLLAEKDKEIKSLKSRLPIWRKWPEEKPTKDGIFPSTCGTAWGGSSLEYLEGDDCWVDGDGLEVIKESIWFLDGVPPIPTERDEK